MRVNTLFVTFFAMISVATAAQDCKCEMANVLYGFVKGLILNFVDAKFQSNEIACLDYVYFGAKEECSCDMKKWVAHIPSENCKDLRERRSDIEKRVMDNTYAKSINWKKALDEVGINDKTACSAIRQFTLLPLSSRSKEAYTKLYNSTVKYVILAWAGSMYDYQKSLEQSATKLKVAECFYDINVATAHLFNIPIGYSLKCLRDAAECKKEEAHIWKQYNG